MVLRESVHALLAGLFLFGIYYDLFLLVLPESHLQKYSSSVGRLKYLTFWNMLLQAGFFSVSLLNDVVVRMSTSSNSDNKRPGKLHGALDFVFASLCFPTSLFVFSSFWAIYAVDRELIFPRTFDTFFPSWLNHIMHTVIGPAVFVEMALVRHIYPSRKAGLAGTLALFAVYLVWIHIIASVWNFWTYPILEVLNFWQRIAFFGACMLFVSAFYFLGDFLYTAVWGKKGHGKREKKKSKAAKKKKST